MSDHYLPSVAVLDRDATSPATVAGVVEMIGRVPLIVADPPYGRIVNATWDNPDLNEKAFTDWMLRWTLAWSEALLDGGAFYIWGGVGRPLFRPFLRFLADVEPQTGLSLANVITWSKKRAYGVSHNYLFTREECAYLIKGDPKKPRTFNIPLTENLRGYAGFDPDHPAKSEFLRRTNVWHESEIFRGKLHECQKADRVSEIPIETNTNAGDVVIDLFAGSGSTSAAARKLGRYSIAIENDPASLEILCNRLA